MTAFSSLITRFRRDKSGASLVEYALLCALIAIAAIVGMTALGSGINTAFSNITTTVTTSTR